MDPSLDSDDDGLLDDWETTFFGNLESMSGLDDPDNDLVINFQEHRNQTDPNDNDTDQDQAIDGLEIAFGSDPKDAGSTPPENSVALIRSQVAQDDWTLSEAWSDGAAPNGVHVSSQIGDHGTP